AVKILENSADYSVMNTARHAMFLPLSRAKKFDGKTAIDTFFWRIGDLIQAAVIYAGLNWLGFDIQHFALLNTLLAVAWIIVAVHIGRGYVDRVSARTTPIRETQGALA
ncbi:MAG: Npt1/Npt2 family nucleotide transporter, partial [Gammaproteobacteria bacterium]